MDRGIVEREICISNTWFVVLKTKLECYGKGMDFYISKPLNHEELYDFFMLKLNMFWILLNSSKFQLIFHFFYFFVSSFSSSENDSDCSIFYSIYSIFLGSFTPFLATSCFNLYRVRNHSLWPDVFSFLWWSSQKKRYLT